jgi:flagellar hook-basal body complex protein FliE
MKLYLWIPICAILIVVVANARTIGDIPAERSLNAEEESEVDENDEANELEEREDANEEKVSTSLLRSLIKRFNGLSERSMDETLDETGEQDVIVRTIMDEMEKEKMEMEMEMKKPSWRKIVCSLRKCKGFVFNGKCEGDGGCEGFPFKKGYCLDLNRLNRRVFWRKKIVEKIKKEKEKYSCS